MHGFHSSVRLWNELAFPLTLEVFSGFQFPYCKDSFLEADMKLSENEEETLREVIEEIKQYLIKENLENKNKKKQIKISIILASFLLINYFPLNHIYKSEISFINVGQGDSTLIQYRNTNILIDTGGIMNKDLAKESLIPFMQKKKIRKLDYVFLTHDDYDHTGAFNSLLSRYKIKDYNRNNNFKECNVNNILFQNLNPSINNIENDDSLVLYFTLNNKAFLLMGDASINIEKKIMKEYSSLKVDYLKVGHHGSKTSSSEAFIKYLVPKEAIISCGVNNRYHHPDKEVLNVLSNNNIKIHRTDIEGTIIVKL